MPSRRSRRARASVALAAAGVLALTGCIMQPQSATSPPQPDASQSDGRGAAPERSADEFDHSVPQHGETPPRYEPQAIWPAQGGILFPDSLGQYEHSGEFTQYSSYLTTIYTNAQYRILSVTVGEDFMGYNARLRLYDNLQYVSDAVCGTENTQSSNDIAWRTCFMVASDGYVSVTAYSTGEVINTSELAQFTEDLYGDLAADVRAADLGSSNQDSTTEDAE